MICNSVPDADEKDPIYPDHSIACDPDNCIGIGYSKIQNVRTWLYCCYKD